MANNKKLKILIVTDSAVLPTGLAETTRLIFVNLIERYPEAYELQQIGLFHCYAVTTTRWPIHPTEMAPDEQGRPVFSPQDKYAQKTFPKLVSTLEPDIVFGFGDPQRMLHLCLPPDQRRYKLILYVNFDGLPLPQNYGAFLRHADLIITKSEFSMRVLAGSLRGAATNKLDYLYSPADVERFKPVLSDAKTELRRDLLPDWMPQNAFILGWVGRNQWRKQVWLLYKTLRYLRSGQYLVCHDCDRVSLLDWDPLQQSHAGRGGLAPESPPGYHHDRCLHCRSTDFDTAAPLLDIFLWCHMPAEPGEEWPVRWLEQQFGVQRDRDVYYTPEHGLKSALSPDDIPALYQLWDCLLYLSGGEGFGLPAWEAMCSGLPVVYTNYSAHGEFLSRANAGLPVGGILQPESKNCVWRMIADVPQAIQAVRALHAKRTLAQELGRNGRSFAEQFRPEIVVEKWHRIFQSI